MVKVLVIVFLSWVNEYVFVAESKEEKTLALPKSFNTVIVWPSRSNIVVGRVNVLVTPTLTLIGLVIKVVNATGLGVGVVDKVFVK